MALPSAPARNLALRTALCLGAAGLCIAGFHDVGHRYLDYRFQYGVGVKEVPPIELAFYVWYLLFGVPAALLLAAGLIVSELPARAVDVFARMRQRPHLWLWAGAALLLAEILLFQRSVLLQAPIADDESTYTFIAQTLLEGRLVNPAPPAPWFFRNQFVVLDGSVWYGKYPIGHPLLLAVGEALALRHWVVPLVTCACFGLTFAVGRRVFPTAEALTGTLLLLVSPHFVFTGATRLSQPTACLFMLLGLWALLRLEDEGRLRWAWLAGLAWGFGVLVRPLPGLLFLPVVAAWVLWGPASTPLRTRLVRAAAGGVPVAIFCGLLLGVNWMQTGDALRSGYHEADGGVALLRAAGGRLAGSIGGSLLRQNFWLFGWSLSLLFVPFVRISRRSLLLVGMVAASYLYRVIATKTVVATTGPIYVTEIVPLLALATGSGMFRVKERLQAWRVDRPAERIAAAAISLVLVAGATFLPVQLRELHRSGLSWDIPRSLLREAAAGPALVFADFMVDLPQTNTWAYYPPNPSPRLDDALVFVRRPTQPDAARDGIELWRRLFPDRSAWVLEYADGRPQVRPVRRYEDLVVEAPRAAEARSADGEARGAL